MKPETEYIARQLAHTVLADRGDTGHIDSAGVGVVEVHMQGMARQIRQRILVDHVSLAGRIADEIERQTQGMNMEATVAAKVNDEISRVMAGIGDVVRQTVEECVRSAVYDRVKHAMTAAAGKMTDELEQRLYDVAYPNTAKRRRAKETP